MMKDGLQIKIYCPDGNPGNMRCASIPNWNGRVLYIHRGYWSDAITGEYRDQLNAPGVYILAGDDSQNGGGRRKIYIGQSGNLRIRIQQHIEDPAKEFFDHVVCVINYDNDLNSAHFKWAESSLIEKAKAISKCEVENRTIPKKPSVSPADRSTINRFLEEVYRVFPAVEMGAFAEPKTLRLTKPKDTQQEMGLGAKKVDRPKTESGEKEHIRAGLPAHLDEMPTSTNRDQALVAKRAHINEDGNPRPQVTAKKKPKPPEPVEIDDDRIANNQHYRVLGLHDMQLLVHVKETCEIIPFARSQLASSGNLMTIAPLDYWIDINNNAGLTVQSRERFADALIRAAHRKGTIKKMHLFVGRGAFVDERSGKVMFNTGTKLLTAGPDGLLTIEKDLSASSNFAMGGEEITVTDDPNARDYARDMADCILDYRWKEKNDGLAFLGWIVTALIGGALKFRPTLWLSANKGADKSFLISDILAKLFVEMIPPIGDPTEAFIAEKTKSDSLPTILDEFEPEGTQMQVSGWLNIMKSIRLASTGNASRGRSGGHGKANMHTARYTTFISSIRRVKMSPATLDRIFPVYFGDEVDDWFELEDRIIDAFRYDKCIAVVSLIIRNAGILANEVKALSRELATAGGMSTRLAAMCAALSVGARFFTENKVVIVSHPEQHQESSQLDLLRELLAATAYQDEGQQFSVADCLTAGYFDNGTWVGRQANGVYSKEARIAASYGFGMLNDHTMLICTSAPRMKKLLARTMHENTDLAHYIRHLPRIQANGKTMTCAGQVCRTKELPLSVYKHAGFDPTATDRESVDA